MAAEATSSSSSAKQQHGDNTSRALYGNAPHAVHHRKGIEVAKGFTSMRAAHRKRECAQLADMLDMHSLGGLNAYGMLPHSRRLPDSHHSLWQPYVLWVCIAIAVLGMLEHGWNWLQRAQSVRLTLSCAVQAPFRPCITSTRA